VNAQLEERFESIAAQLRELQKGQQRLATTIGEYVVSEKSMEALHAPFEHIQQKLAQIEGIVRRVAE